MTRPANPSFVVPTFATDASYPAGGSVWSSQPVKVAFGAPAGGFVPGQPAAAPYFNKLFNDAYTTDAANKTSLQSLYDHAAQAPGLNWFSGAALSLDDVAWNAGRRSWMAIGNGINTLKSVQESFTHGQIFGTNLISGLGGAAPAQACLKIACDPTGNAVVTTFSGAVYEYAFASSTWTYRSAAFSFGPAASSQAYAILFDGSRWLAYTTEASVRQLRSSTDRATWTDRTTAIASSNVNQMYLGRLASDGAGRAVSCAVIGPSSGITEFLASTDGFATVVGGTYGSISHGITTVAQHNLTYTASSGQFVYNVSSSTIGKVYVSTDGLSWTLAASLGLGGRIQRIACHGEMWIGVVPAAGGSSYLVISLDRGVTWRAVGFTLEAGATNTALVSSGEQFMATGTSTGVYYSAKSGIGFDIIT